MTASLRTRKKQNVRDQLSLATIVLAQERGLANVRVEDIVDRVGVSRRTFSNYFASKEDAIADRHVQRTQLAAQALRERPKTESLWDAITAVIVEPYAERLGDAATKPRDEQDGLIAVLGDPDMHMAIARGSRLAVDEFARAIADRLGEDVHTDAYPRLVANAALNTQLVIVDFWLHSEPPAQLVSLLQDAFRHLGAGFDSPRPRLRPRPDNGQAKRRPATL